MNALTDRLDRAVGRDARRMCAQAALRSAARWAPGAAVLVALAIRAGPDRGWALLGGAVFLLAIAALAALRVRRGVDARLLTSALDARCDAQGALLTLGTVPAQSRFAPLIAAQAAAALERDPGALPLVLRRASLMRLVLSVVAAAVLACWPQGAVARESSTDQEPPQSAVPNTDAVAGALRPDAPQAPVPAGDLLLEAERRVLGRDDDMLLRVSWMQTSAAGAAAPLRFVALLSDGHSGADLGFGRDQRPVRLTQESELRTTRPWSELHFDLSARALLRQSGVEGDGLVRLCVVALARLSDGSEFEVRSAALSLNLVTEKSVPPQTMMAKVALEPRPMSVPQGSRQPRAGLGGGGGDIELGAPEELGKATLVRKAVKPIVTDEGLIEKEVDVLERAPGAPVKPMPDEQPREESAPAAVPRQQEQPGLRARWSAAELRLIERYFRRLRPASGR